MIKVIDESFEILQQKWVANFDMLIEINKNKFSVPIASELLRNVKSMINEAVINKTAADEFLAVTDSLLDEANREIFSAAEPLGSEFTERWEKVFRKIMAGEKYGEYILNSSRFYPHLPRGKYWVRLKQPAGTTPERLREIAREYNVFIKRHQKEHIVITGDKEKVKEALRELAVYLKRSDTI